MDSDQTDLIIFHKNLRIKDNESLYYGSLRQNYRCIYIFDPKYRRGNGKSVRQLYFLKDCLLDFENQKYIKNFKIFKRSNTKKDPNFY